MGGMGPSAHRMERRKTYARGLANSGNIEGNSDSLILLENLLADFNRLF